MSDKILPIQPNYHASTSAPEAPPPLRPRPYVLYRYTPSSPDPNHTADPPVYRFSDEVFAPPKHLAAFIEPSDWTPIAILHVPAIIRDHDGFIRYTYPDGTAFTADELIQKHHSFSEITLKPIF